MHFEREIDPFKGKKKYYVCNSNLTCILFFGMKSYGLFVGIGWLLSSDRHCCGNRKISETYYAVRPPNPIQSTPTNFYFISHN
jgi:hypothetical protein